MERIDMPYSWVFSSCRNRHCPQCQGHKRETWVQAREKELLNVPYFHVIPTLPDTLDRLCSYGIQKSALLNAQSQLHSYSL